MTLSQEISAVMMVSLEGSLTPAVLNEWRSRQFGGLLLRPAGQKTQDPSSLRATIESLRGVMAHPVLVSTDEQGVDPQGLKARGFDLDLSPIADVGAEENPRTVARNVTATVARLHAAGLYAVAEHFPGAGTAKPAPDGGLPRVDESADTIRNRDWIPFKAAIAAGVDMIMVGEVRVPALDSTAPSLISATVMHALRSELGYQGVVIGDEFGSTASTWQPTTSDATVRFLENGGDMVIIPDDLALVDAVVAAIHDAVLTGSYQRSQLDGSVQKLLNLGLRFMP